MCDSKYELLHLEHQLCFPLYASSRELIKLYKPVLDRIGLTYTQYITMLLLWEHRSLTAKELGEFLHLDSGTLTPLLKKLEAKGLLTRRRAAMDERSLIVTITEAGVQLRDEALCVPEEMDHLSLLTLEERAQLRQLLHKLLDCCRNPDHQT